MALICMAVHDTEENKRTAYTLKTIKSLSETVDFSKHRIVIIDNGSCKETKELYKQLSINYLLSKIQVIHNDTNLGTAKAINKGLKLREPNEFAIKLDNDVVFHKKNWVDEMEEVITRMPKIGILGLKRRDICESTYSVNPDQKSRLLEVPHENGQKWYVVEECRQVMGTCTMLNPALLERIGYFYQMDGLYGFDDSILCVRSSIAGFMNCFLHGVDIDHIDPGGDAYTDWKAKYAGEMIWKYADAERAYRTGLKDIYYGGE